MIAYVSEAVDLMPGCGPQTRADQNPRLLSVPDDSAEVRTRCDSVCTRPGAPGPRLPPRCCCTRSPTCWATGTCRFRTGARCPRTGWTSGTMPVTGQNVGYATLLPVWDRIRGTHGQRMRRLQAWCDSMYKDMSEAGRTCEWPALRLGRRLLRQGPAWRGEWRCAPPVTVPSSLQACPPSLLGRSEEVRDAGHGSGREGTRQTW